MKCHFTAILMLSLFLNYADYEYPSEIILKSSDNLKVNGVKYKIQYIIYTIEFFKNAKIWDLNYQNAPIFHKVIVI